MATAPAKAPDKVASPRDVLRKQMERQTTEFEAAMPQTGPGVERFKRVALTAILENPDLLEADRASLFSACNKAATDGLLPDGREGAFVVFNTKNRQTEQWEKRVQWMPMIRGIIKKARGSGELSSIRAHLVCQNDVFRYVLGDQEQITHEPNWDDRGTVVGAYGIAVLRDGAVEREYMTAAEIEEVRQVSRAKDRGPWVDWWGEMAKKTVLRRLSKRLPMSTDLEQVMTRDDDLYQLKAPSIDAPPRPERPAIAACPPYRDVDSDEVPEDKSLRQHYRDKAEQKRTEPEDGGQPEPEDDPKKPEPYQFVNWDGEVTGDLDAEGFGVGMQIALGQAADGSIVQGLWESNLETIKRLSSSSHAELAATIVDAREARLRALAPDVEAESEERPAGPEMTEAVEELRTRVLGVIADAETIKELDAGWNALAPELRSGDCPSAVVDELRSERVKKRAQLLARGA